MTLASFCYLIGYLTGLAAFALLARRRGLATEGIMAVAGAGLIGGLLGANLGQWICARVFHDVAAGKSVLGGLAGGYLAVMLYKRHLGIQRPTGDLFAVALTAGEAVGRWGCFFAGCCYGTVTTVPWAVSEHGQMRHPTQIYSSAACALILAVLLCVEKTRPPESTLFYLQGPLFCVARFAVEFFRVGPPPVAGLTLAQWACAAGFVFFAVKLTHLLRPHRVRPARAAVSGELNAGELHG